MPFIRRKYEMNLTKSIVKFLLHDASKNPLFLLISYSIISKRLPAFLRILQHYIQIFFQKPPRSLSNHPFNSQDKSSQKQPHHHLSMTDQIIQEQYLKQQKHSQSSIPSSPLLQDISSPQTSTSVAQQALIRSEIEGHFTSLFETASLLQQHPHTQNPTTPANSRRFRNDLLCFIPFAIFASTLQSTIQLLADSLKTKHKQRLNSDFPALNDPHSITSAILAEFFESLSLVGLKNIKSFLRQKIPSDESLAATIEAAVEATTTTTSPLYSPKTPTKLSSQNDTTNNNKIKQLNDIVFENIDKSLFCELFKCSSSLKKPSDHKKRSSMTLFRIMQSSSSSSSLNPTSQQSSSSNNNNSFSKTAQNLSSYFLKSAKKSYQSSRRRFIKHSENNAMMAHKQPIITRNQQFDALFLFIGDIEHNKILADIEFIENHIETTDSKCREHRYQPPLQRIPEAAADDDRAAGYESDQSSSPDNTDSLIPLIPSSSPSSNNIPNFLASPFKHQNLQFLSPNSFASPPAAAKHMSPLNLATNSKRSPQSNTPTQQSALKQKLKQQQKVSPLSVSSKIKATRLHSREENSKVNDDDDEVTALLKRIGADNDDDDDDESGNDSQDDLKHIRSKKRGANEKERHPDSMLQDTSMFGFSLFQPKLASNKSESNTKLAQNNSSGLAAGPQQIQMQRHHSLVQNNNSNSVNQYDKQSDNQMGDNNNNDQENEVDDSFQLGGLKKKAKYQKENQNSNLLQQKQEQSSQQKVQKSKLQRGTSLDIEPSSTQQTTAALSKLEKIKYLSMQNISNSPFEGEHMYSHEFEGTSDSEVIAENRKRLSQYLQSICIEALDMISSTNFQSYVYFASRLAFSKLKTRTETSLKASSELIQPSSSSSSSDASNLPTLDLHLRILLSIKKNIMEFLLADDAQERNLNVYENAAIQAAEIKANPKSKKSLDEEHLRKVLSVLREIELETHLKKAREELTRFFLSL